MAPPLDDGQDAIATCLPSEKNRKMAVSISQVSFEHHRVAFGIGEATPRISWQFDGDAVNWIQSSYDIEVSRLGGSSPEVFHVESPESLLVSWPTEPLGSADSAVVRIKASGQDGQPETPWSDLVTVETGLLNDEDWLNAVVMAAETPLGPIDQPKQPSLLRKDFDLPGEIASARLYITAYGVYEAFINGQRVGDAVLSPGWQSYNHRLVYNTYDVTDLLSSGENAVGIQVGEGWYAGRIGFGGSRNFWGSEIGAQALLVATGPDGTKTEIVTDLSWSSGSGPIITSEIYNGEVYNSTLEQPGWSAPGFQPRDDAEWIGVKELSSAYGRLTAPDGPPLSRIEEVQLREILTSPSGKTILDFGQNLVGWLRLTVAGPRGHNVTLHHVEVLSDGEIATEPLRSATQRDTILLSGNGTQTWEPTFTYHGFRYVQVDNWPVDETPLDSSSVVAVVVHSDMRETGSLETSNDLLNKLISNVRWSMKGNFFGVPTDCPQRDERLGWTGDAHAFAPTANFLYDTAGFWNAWLKDVASEGIENNGIVPAVVPLVPGLQVEPTAVWSDVVVAVPWNVYSFFGDVEALGRQYAGAKAWIDQGIPRVANGLWNQTYFQYGDWLDPTSPPEDPAAAKTSRSYVADAYLVYVTDLISQIATTIGSDDDAASYADQATQLRSAFRDLWIKDDGTVANETQTGLTLALWFDLFTNPGEDVAAAGRLQQIIADNDYLVGTGFAGTHLLGLALSKYNLTDTFYEMLLQTTVPSWLYQVVQNGTTTWERWDSLLADGSLNTGSMTSFNHYAFGSVANWIFQNIAGLAPAEPGWKTVDVKVSPGGGITQAKADYISPYGRVSTDWYIDGEGFHLEVVVPPNAEARVTLPGIDTPAETVGSGSHVFTVPGFQL